MKKILTTGGVVMALFVLAGCAAKSTPPTIQQPSPLQTSPATNPAPSDSSMQNNSMTPDSSTTNLPMTPAKTSDVDNSLNQVTKDLNSIDSSAPNPNDLNSANLQK